VCCVWWWCGERERGALTLVNQSHPHQLVHQEANEEGQHEEKQQDHLGTEAPSMSRGTRSPGQQANRGWIIERNLGSLQCHFLTQEGISVNSD